MMIPDGNVTVVAAVDGCAGGGTGGGGGTCFGGVDAMIFKNYAWNSFGLK